MTVPDAIAATLLERGVARVPGCWPDQAAAWPVALQVMEHARDLDPLCAGLPALEVVGEFTAPPPGTVQRDFQALHIDYGVPLLAAASVAVSRFTALYLDAHQAGSGSATRIAGLRSLLGQRGWAPREVLAERLCSDAAADGVLVEGIFGRIIEAADQSADLPDRDADGFLCGMEFSALEDERRYFAGHGLDLVAVEEEFVLSSGEMLIFDNLVTVHGRRGRRNTGELHQLCVGFGSLDLAAQALLLDRILGLFDSAHEHAECGRG
jgi:hypothetical protein